MQQVFEENIIDYQKGKNVLRYVYIMLHKKHSKYSVAYQTTHRYVDIYHSDMA